MQNKGPPPPPFSKSRPPPPPQAAKISSSRRTQEAKKDTKSAVTKSRQRNNFVKQLKECINAIAPQLSDQLANDIEDEIFKICGFKQTAREYRDNGGQIKKKISDTRYRHVASKLKDKDLDISAFVQQILNAKPEEVAKVKPGQGFPTFLSQPPPALSQIKLEEKMDNLSEREVSKADENQAKRMLLENNEAQTIFVPKIANSKPSSRKVSKASSSNMQPDIQTARDQSIKEENINFGQLQKQQGVFPQPEQFNPQKQFPKQNALEQSSEHTFNQPIFEKQQHQQKKEAQKTPLISPSNQQQSVIINKEIPRASTTKQSQNLKEEDELNEPSTNRQKMKKAKNQLLALISKPKVQSKNYHPSPVNQRGKLIQKQPSLAQSYIQPYNESAMMNNQNTDVSRANPIKKPPKRPNSRVNLASSQTDRKQIQSTKDNLNQTIAQNPSLYSSQQLVQQHNEINQKLILDKFETQSTLSNYNEKGSTSFHKIRPFSAQEFIESHKKKKQSAASSPKNSQQDPNENANQKQNNYTISSSIIGPSQTPSRHGPASITTYNQSMCNLQQAYDTRKKQLQEAKKLLTKSQLELKAERKKGELLSDENSKLHDQLHKLQKKKKSHRERDADYVDENDEISSQNTSSDEQKSNNIAKQQQVEMQKLRKQLNLQLQELNNLKSSIQGKNKVIEQMNRSNQEIKNRYQNYKEQMNKTIHQLTTNMQRKNQKSQQLQQQQQSSAQKLRAQANAYQIQIQRLKQQCNKLKQQNQTLRRNNSQRQQAFDSPQNYSLRSNNSNSQLLNLRQESDIIPVSTTTPTPAPHTNNISRNSSSLSELHPSILSSTAPANNYLTRTYNSDQASIRQQDTATEYMSDSNIIYQSGSGFQQYQPMIVPPSSSGSADHQPPNYPTVINEDTGEYHLVSVTDAIGGGAGAADSVLNSEYQHQSESGGAGDFFGQRTTFTHLYSHQQSQNVSPYQGQYPQGEYLQNTSTSRSSQRPQAVSNAGHHRNEQNDRETTNIGQIDDRNNNINMDDGQDIVRNSGQGQGMGGMMHNLYDQRRSQHLQQDEEDYEEQKKLNAQDKKSNYPASQYSIQGQSGGVDQLFFGVGRSSSHNSNKDNHSMINRSSKQNFAGGSGEDIGLRMDDQNQQKNQINWREDNLREEQEKNNEVATSIPSTIYQSNQHGFTSNQIISPQTVQRQQEFNQSGSGGGKSEKQKERPGESGSTALVESNRRILAQERKNTFSPEQEDKNQGHVSKQQRQFISGIGQTNQDERSPQEASSGAGGQLIRQQRNSNNIASSTTNNQHSIFQMIDQYTSPSSSSPSAIINNRNTGTAAAGGGLFNQDPSQSSGQALPASAITPAVAIHSQNLGGAPASSTPYESRSRSPATIPLVDMHQQQQQPPLSGLPFQFQEIKQEVQDTAPASSSGMQRGNCQQNSILLRAGIQNTGATGNSYQSTTNQEEQKYFGQQEKNPISNIWENSSQNPRDQYSVQSTHSRAQNRRRQQQNSSKESPPIPSNLFQVSNSMNLLDLQDNTDPPKSIKKQNQNLESVPGNLFSFSDIFSTQPSSSSSSAMPNQHQSQQSSLFTQNNSLQFLINSNQSCPSQSIPSYSTASHQQTQYHQQPLQHQYQQQQQQQQQQSYQQYQQQNPYQQHQPYLQQQPQHQQEHQQFNNQPQNQQYSQYQPQRQGFDYGMQRQPK